MRAVTSVRRASISVLSAPASKLSSPNILASASDFSSSASENRSCSSKVSIWSGLVCCEMATREQAVSMRLMALSGKRREGIKRIDRSTAALIASSRIKTLWCWLSPLTTARKILTDASRVGSSIVIAWKRRDRAGSFSKYFLYSEKVVAAMVRKAPRANAGFSRLAASFCPSVPPAPIIVWASSMKTMIGVGEDWTSLIKFFKRSSNSPFTLAPACKSPMSKLTNAAFFNCSGTSPEAIFSASPSTTAVFPTPGWPRRIGLFCLLRSNTSITLETSLVRPRTVSSVPSRAAAVRFTVYFCSAVPSPVA